MSAFSFRDPIRAIVGGVVYPGATLSIFNDDSVTRTAIYADPGFETLLSNPLTANAAGRFPAIYVATGVVYRALLQSAAGATVFDQFTTPRVLPLGVIDSQPRDDGGDLMPFAVRTFYAAQTTALETIYADDGLSVPLANPLTADAAGTFPDIRLDPVIAYRALLKDRYGRLIFDHNKVSIDVTILPPSPPVLSGHAVDASSNHLEWTAAFTEFSVITQYRLYRKVNAGAFVLIATLGGAVLSFEDTDVALPDTWEYYVVATALLGGDSTQSNHVTISAAAITDIYNVAGTFTWTKRTGLVKADVPKCLGGGAGGGGGSLGSSERSRPGGQGGGGGGASNALNILAAALAATVTVTVGARGIGGAARTGSNVNGNDGTSGGASSFGAHCSANGGTRGQGGHVAGGAGQPPGGGEGGTGTLANGGDGGHPGNGDFTSPPTAGGNSTYGGGGGGAGGGRGSGANESDASAGGNGDTSGTTQNGGAAGGLGTNGVAGESASNAAGGGGGGGGPYYFPSVITVGSGAPGGSFGAGGGGGGAIDNTGPSGAGNDGTGGLVIVVSYFR